jgi:hypothetical protein
MAAGRASGSWPIVRPRIDRAVAEQGSRMHVELLQHQGCPLAPAALELVQRCLRVLCLPVAVLERVGDYPSPTVLVNGTDVMGTTSESLTARVCRVDVPTRERVLAALRAALAAESVRGDRPREPPPQPS